MKLDSFTSDIYAIQEDVNCPDRESMECICDVCGNIQARLLNIVKRECSEEDFLNEDYEMESIPEWPAPEEDF